MERRTKQRNVIWDTIKNAGRPVGPQDILELSHSRLPKLGIATVYRTIKALLVDQQITAVETPGQAPKYELADLKHHHHFVCRTCGKTFDIAGCPPGIDSLAPEGFVVEDHYLTLEGRCPKCS